MIFEEFRKSAILVKRYPLSLVAGVLVLSLIFIGLYETAFGFSSDVLDESEKGSRATIPIQKFLIWVTLISGFSSISDSIKTEAQSGTLEVLFLSSRPVVYIYVIKALVTTCISFCIVMLIMFVLSAYYGAHPEFNLHYFAGLVSTFFAAIGVGFFVGSLTLYFKDIGPLTNLIQFLLLPILLGGIISVNHISMVIIPGYAPTLLTGDAGNVSSNEYLIYCGLNSLLWFLVGVLVLIYAASKVKRSGTVNQY